MGDGGDVCACERPCEARLRGGLLHSFKEAYDVHVLVATDTPAEQWPAKIGAAWPEMHAVVLAGKRLKLARIHARVTVVEPLRPDGPGEGRADVVLYPLARVLWNVAPETAARAVDILGEFPDDLARARAALDALGAVAPPWDVLVAVCVHGTRDRRCGRAGPRAIDAIEAALRSRRGADAGPSVRTVGCSHIGGHKHAGVLCVFPRGDWFGLVSGPGAAVDALAQYILDPGPDTLPAEYFRGRMGGPAGADAERCVRKLAW